MHREDGWSKAHCLCSSANQVLDTDEAGNTLCYTSAPQDALHGKKQASAEAVIT